MPWKNGGGETVEIAVSPEGAGLADFDWRVSMATVASDGPFSVFASIDRTLSILDGAGMTLAIEGRDPVHLTQQSPPLPFPADMPTAATLIDGPITDLNVMTRRGRLSHSVERIVVAGETQIELQHTTTLFLCQSGALDIVADGERVALASGDCLMIDSRHGAPVAVSGKALLFRIGIEEIFAA
jgi:hypothetical protein